MGGVEEPLGKSIIVPSVQELAKAKGSMVRVPDRYIQHDDDDQDPLISTAADNEELQVPIINMEALLSGDGTELIRLHSACQHWGFFQVTNHGVSSSLVEKFKLETQEFFNLSLEEKKKYWQTPKDVEGFGQAFVVSEEQKLDWADIFYLTTLPKHLQKPHLFPMLPLPYRDTLETYSKELQNLAVKLLDCMAKALNIEAEVMRGVFGEGMESIRMNYYPPCPQPDKVIGLTPHSDASALTILLQLNEMDGLQIRKDDKWVSIQPAPHAFVVNVGDILEIMSNGIYRSIMHRAVVNSTKERLSVATFYYPALDKEVGPILDLITPKNPAKFTRISLPDYMKGFLSRVLDRKSYLDVFRIPENDDA